MATLHIISQTHWRRIAVSPFFPIQLDADIDIPEYREYLLVTKDLTIDRIHFYFVDRLVKTTLTDCYEVIRQGKQSRESNFNLYDIYTAHDSWKTLHDVLLQVPDIPMSLHTFCARLEKLTRALFMPFHLYLRPNVRKIIEASTAPPWIMIKPLLENQDYFLPPDFGTKLDQWGVDWVFHATQGAIKVILKNRTVPQIKRHLDGSALLHNDLPFSIRHLTDQVHPNLGKGGFGKVLLLQIDAPPTSVAIKTFTHSLDKLTWKTFFNEVLIHHALSDEPHVIRCHGAVILMGDHPNPIIIMESLIPLHISGPFCDRLDRICSQIKKSMPTDLATAAVRYFQRHAILAVESVHARGFLHLDVKPANFIAGIQNGRWILKITDFGFSASRDALHRSTQRFIPRGTYKMVAPEILMGSLPDYSSDMFSLGATLYFTETNKLPLAYKKEPLHCTPYQRLSSYFFDRLAYYRSKLPVDIANWVVRALDEIPALRPTAPELSRWWASISPPDSYPANAFDAYFPSPQKINDG